MTGIAAAWLLASEGVDVLLLERKELCAGASGTNAGSIHQQIPVAEYCNHAPFWASHFAPTLVMMKAGAEMWGSLQDRLDADLEFRQSGGIIAAMSEAELEIVRSKAALEAEYGICSEELNSASLRERAPYISSEAVGGAFYPGEGKANPMLATRALARAAISAGAGITTQTEVRSLESGQEFRLETESGTMRSNRVICAAGAESGRIAAMAGLDLPIRGYPIQVSVTEPVGPLVEHLVYSAAGKLTVKQLANGNCIVGGGWPSTIGPDGSLSVSCESLCANMRMARSVIPALNGIGIIRSWPAIVNGTDSWRPVVGEAPRCPGFFVCLFPWMGFTAGLIAARCATDLVLGRTPPVDVASLSEFLD